MWFRFVARGARIKTQPVSGEVSTLFGDCLGKKLGYVTVRASRGNCCCIGCACNTFTRSGVPLQHLRAFGRVSCRADKEKKLMELIYLLPCHEQKVAIDRASSQPERDAIDCRMPLPCRLSLNLFTGMFHFAGGHVTIAASRYCVPLENLYLP